MNVNNNLFAILTFPNFIIKIVTSFNAYYIYDGVIDESRIFLRVVVLLSFFFFCPFWL